MCTGRVGGIYIFITLNRQYFLNQKQFKECCPLVIVLMGNVGMNYINKLTP